MRETPSLRELTPLALLLGVVIGVVFGVAQAYVGLKVGMTISASIPAAVISMGVLRGLLKRGTLLENNMVQTIGSAGESLAAGMIFTIPALYIFGFEPKFLEMVIWGALGGLLGVLFMIPLRRVLIV
ncbi:MAG: OPT/YSL family transporter, partial [Planctomycetes bacterium]|nr:OPT/YSL family transporter [Planctomycetota bacterium]